MHKSHRLGAPHMRAPCPASLRPCHDAMLPRGRGTRQGEGKVDRTLPKWPASLGKMPLSGPIPAVTSGGCIPGRAGSVPGARLQLLVIRLLGQDGSKLRSTHPTANRPHVGCIGASSPFSHLPPPPWPLLPPSSSHPQGPAPPALPRAHSSLTRLQGPVSSEQGEEDSLHDGGRGRAEPGRL